MRILGILLLVCLVHFAFAQQGNYFLTNVHPGDDKFNQVTFDIGEDSQGVLYFANRSGVLQYDGREWTEIPVHSAVFRLLATKDGRLIAAGTGGIGQIWRNHGKAEYRSLTDSVSEVKEIFSAAVSSRGVFFVNENALFAMDSLNHVQRIASAGEAEFTGVVESLGDILVTSSDGKLLKFEGSKLEPASWNVAEGDQIIAAENSPDGKRSLIATDNSRLYVRGRVLVEVITKEPDYLKNLVISNVVWVTDKLVAIGTLRGGVVFLNPETGEIMEKATYQTGLADNEVFALHTDKHQGVWTAHDFGFTRIAPFLPFRTFSHYPGLTGNLLAVQSVGSQVYVGTSTGLFVLVEEPVIVEEKYKVPVKGKAKPVVVEPPKSEKRGFLGLFKRKKKEEPVKPTKASGNKPKEQFITKTRKVQAGTQYVYKPVEGITGKTDMITVVRGELFCAGVSGLRRVNGTKSTVVYGDPVRLVLYARSLNQILVSNYEDEIRAFGKNGVNWTENTWPDSLSMYADFLFEDAQQNVWVFTRDHAVKVGVENGNIVDVSNIRYPRSSVDKPAGTQSGKDVLLTQNGNFYKYASYKDGFVPLDSMPGPKKYFAAQGSFWYYDGHSWKTPDKQMLGVIRPEWLGLFTDIRYLSPAQEGKSLWVITSGNELYRFNGDSPQASFAPNPLFLKSARTSAGPVKSLQVEEQESSITFEFIQPQYIAGHAVEYRYLVKGLQTKWTDWSSTNNIISFPFLPSGSYDISVQAKDIFGRVSELQPVTFSVIPPYWKRTWFYALEFVFFGMLVLLTLRLNVAKTTNIYIAQFLSALTLIMLIQFIQTVVAANINLKSTPVVEFFLQVLIALLILPVEELIRKRMMNARKK